MPLEQSGWQPRHSRDVAAAIAASFDQPSKQGPDRSQKISSKVEVPRRLESLELVADLPDVEHRRLRGVHRSGLEAIAHVPTAPVAESGLAQVGQRRRGRPVLAHRDVPPLAHGPARLSSPTRSRTIETMMITTASNSMAAPGTSAVTTIHADELQPGDVFVYDGHRHHITRIDRRDGWAWPIAGDDTGWAIALGHQLIDVHRKAA